MGRVIRNTVRKSTGGRAPRLQLAPMAARRSAPKPDPEDDAIDISDDSEDSHTSEDSHDSEVSDTKVDLPRGWAAKSTGGKGPRKELNVKTFERSAPISSPDSQIPSKVAKSDNLSLLLYGTNDLRLEQTPPPREPEPDEVQLATHTVGICGSDLHCLTEGDGDIPLDEPVVMGHESSATVVKVGESVKKLKVGDRVAVEPGVTCGECEFCTTGRYNLCRDVQFQSCPPFNGSMRRLYNHKADLCFKLPDNLSFGEGAIIEPLAVAVYGVKKLNLADDPHHKVLVIGAGPIGLLVGMVAKAYGVNNICIIDSNESRLQLADSLGIPFNLKTKSGETTHNVVKRVKEVFGDLPDITMECTGVEACLNIAIDGTREGGRVALFGRSRHKVSVSLSSAGSKELQLIGIRRYVDNSDAIKLVSSGKLNVKPLITHVFQLEEGVKAFEKAKSCDKGVMKVHIVWDNRDSN